MIYTLLAAICTAKVYNVALDWSECQLYLSELLIGDSVIFTGSENSSSGYLWQITQDNSQVYEITSNEYFAT